MLLCLANWTQLQIVWLQRADEQQREALPPQLLVSQVRTFTDLGWNHFLQQLGYRPHHSRHDEGFPYDHCRT